MPQASFSFAMSPYFARRSAMKAFFAACSGGDFSAATASETFVAPRHFVVREIADAPRVARALAALAFHVAAQRGGEARVEHVRELAPVTLAAFDHLRPAAADGVGVGREPHQERGARPTSWRWC